MGQTEAKYAQMKVKMKRSISNVTMMPKWGEVARTNFSRISLMKTFSSPNTHNVMPSTLSTHDVYPHRKCSCKGYDKKNNSFTATGDNNKLL